MKAEKSGETFFEVKGRAEEWQWVTCTEAEVDLLEKKPDPAFLLEIIIHPKTMKLKKIKKWSAKNIIDRKVKAIALYFEE